MGIEQRDVKYLENGKIKNISQCKNSVANHLGLRIVMRDVDLETERAKR